MLDYRKLSQFRQKQVDEMIKKEVEPGHHVTSKGFEYDEPDNTLRLVQQGHNCAECLQSDYDCLCDHV